MSVFQGKLYKTFLAMSIELPLGDRMSLSKRNMLIHNYHSIYLESTRYRYISVLWRHVMLQKRRTSDICPG